MSTIGIQRKEVSFKEGFPLNLLIPSNEQKEAFIQKGASVVIGRQVMRDTENHDSIRGVDAKNTGLIRGELLHELPENDILFHSSDIKMSDVILKVQDLENPYPMNRFQVSPDGKFWIQLEGDEYLWYSVEHSSDIPDVSSKILGACDTALQMPTFLHPSVSQWDPTQNQDGILTVPLQFQPDSPRSDIDFKKKTYELAMRAGLGQLGDCPEGYILNSSNVHTLAFRLSDKGQIEAIERIARNERQKLDEGESSDFLDLLKAYYFGAVGCLLEQFVNNGHLTNQWEDLRSIDELGELVMNPDEIVPIYTLYSATQPQKVAYIIDIVNKIKEVGRKLSYEDFGKIINGEFELSQEERDSFELLKKVDLARITTEEWFPNDDEVLCRIFNVSEGLFNRVTNLELLERGGIEDICDTVYMMKKTLSSLYQSDIDKERKFLQRENPAMENESPRDIIVNGGIEYVLQILEAH